MKFVYPEFLWAAFVIIIPIIIHLFSFRRYKTIYFSQVKFLREVTEDSRAGMKLKHLLVLISRILALLFLVFAFAQPYIPRQEQNGHENVSLVYLDNSLSMEALGSDGDLLNEIKNRALELVESFPADEKVVLVNGDLRGDQFRFYTPDQVAGEIKKTDYSSRAAQMTTVVNSLLDFANINSPGANVRLFLFSDFQASTADLENLRRAEIPCYYFQASAEQKENIYIDSVWFASPVHRLNTPGDVFFRVQNLSDMKREDLTVTLEISGNSPAPQRISVEANSSATGSFNYTDRTAGIKTGSISVATSQLYFDDRFFFSYETKEQVEILLIKNSADDSRNLEQLYSLDSYYHLETALVNSVTADQFRNKELILFQNVNRIPGGIVNQIREALKTGSSVVIIPGTKPDFQNLNQVITEFNLPGLSPTQVESGELSYFNDQDPVYYGVFESTPKNYKHPSVSQSYKMDVKGNQNFITLFGLGKSSPYLIYGSQGNGRVILMASPLQTDFTDFQNHALFAATFIRFAETAAFQTPLSLTIGDMNNFPLMREPDEKQPIHLINNDFKADFIPLVISTGNAFALSFAQIQDQIRNSGFYELSDQKNFKQILALNYNRQESVTTSLTREEISESFARAGWKNAQPLVSTPGEAIDLSALTNIEFWRLCLIISLIFFAVEILLLKLWKS